MWVYLMCFEIVVVVIHRLMICKAAQATPQAANSTALEYSSSQEGSGLNAATRREMEVNCSAGGNKMVDSKEMVRLFPQANTQDPRVVSPH